jgi:type II secretory pathway pseudopilin PulG
MKGFTLVEALIGVFLILVVFLGIFGAFQLGLKIVAQSKAKIGALSLANQRIEEIRNLPYNDVGTIGGIPPGVVAQQETVALNNIDYTIRTTIIYVDDPFDGTAPDDPIPSDYKRAKVAVSWPSVIGGEVSLITDIAPKGIETTEGGGTLLITVLDSLGLPVSQAEVQVVNDQVDPQIDASYFTDDQGNLILAGAPTSTEAYKITATKEGWSTDRTYGKEEVANPKKPHASVYEGKLTEIGFSIDKTSSFLVETRAQESFDDQFNNSSKISEISNLVLEEGLVRLKTISSYASSGYLVSQEISPPNLYNWDSLFFLDDEPEGTNINYQIYYATSTLWALVPDSDLPGNSSGLDDSPVDLSSLSISSYPKLKIRANFSTSDPSLTPFLDEWHLYYNTPLIPNVNFHLQGEKTIGTDADDQPVYKYSKDHQSDSQGKLTIAALEWDSYDFSATSTNIDLIRVNPENPIDLLPDTTESVGLYFSVENSLLVKVLDSLSLEPIFGANVRLFNQELGYDQDLPTDQNGNAYFLPLDSGNYNLEVSAPNYQDFSTNIFISGHSTKTIYLESL